jgi:hypothetical protein
MCVATPPLIFGFEPHVCGSLRARGLSTGRPGLAMISVRQLVGRGEVTNDVSGARIRHASVTSSFRRAGFTCASRSITGGEPSWPGVVRRVSGSRSKVPACRPCLVADE